MSRPRKNGLDYFPHDVTAMNDEKLTALQHLYGNDGYAFYFKILEMIYRGFTEENSGLSLKNKNMRIVVRKNVGVDEGLFSEMIETSLQLNLFERDLYEQSQVLSSKRIIDTYKEVQFQREKQREKYSKKQGEKRDKVKESKVKNTPLPPNGGICPSFPELTPEEMQKKSAELRARFNNG